MPAPKNMKIAYTVTPPLKEGGKEKWTEIGVSFDNDNDSVSINLVALPVNGKIVLMPIKEKTEGQQ